MYVWLDALTNYLTGVGYPDNDQRLIGRYWPADLHMIGKDVVRFHAVYWPAFLMSAGIPLPKQVFGHGFVLHRGEKMSKSVGNVVDPLELARRFRGRPAALLPASRRHLRAGRQLQRRGDRHPGQCRSRQQLRQSRPAHALVHRQELRRACCLAEGRGEAADGELLDTVRRAVREELPGHFERSRAQPGDRGLDARRLRLQPIYRRAGALDAAQDRSGADEGGARDALRGDRRSRRRDPAGDPGERRQAARRRWAFRPTSAISPLWPTRGATSGSPLPGFTLAMPTARSFPRLEACERRIGG